MSVSDPIFAVIGVLALGLIAGGGIIVIDALIIRRIRRPKPSEGHPPKDRDGPPPTG